MCLAPRALAFSGLFMQTDDWQRDETFLSPIREAARPLIMDRKLPFAPLPSSAVVLLEVLAS